MSAGNELYYAEQWLGSVFKSGTALCSLLAGGTVAPCIHPDFVPQGSAHPGLVIDLAQGEDEFPVTGTPNASLLRARIRGVVQDTAYGLAGTIFQRAHVLIGGRQGTVLDGSGTAMFVLSCIRVGLFRYPEVFEGKNYRHVGGEYDLWVECP